MKSHIKISVLFFSIFFLLTSLLLYIRLGAIWSHKELLPLFISNSSDSFTSNAFKLKYIVTRKFNSNDIVFILIGSSANRENIISDAYIRHQIQKHSKKTVHFYSLCSSNQTFSESSKVINYLNKYLKSPVLFVFPMEPLKFSFSYERQVANNRYFYLNTPIYTLSKLQVFADSNQRDKRYKENDLSVAYRTLKILLSRLNRKIDAFLKNRNILHEYNRHRYYYKQLATFSVSTEKRREVLSRLKKACRNYFIYNEMNYGILEACIKNIHPRHGVILTDTPTNPYYSKHIDESIYEDYVKRIKTLVRSYDLIYYDLSTEHLYEHTQFIDYRHMMTPTPNQIQYSDALVNVLKKHCR